MRQADLPMAGRRVHALLVQLDRDDLSILDLLQNLLEIVAHDRRPQRENAVENGPKRVNIRADIELSGGCLLGRHESRRPHHLPADGSQTGAQFFGSEGIDGFRHLDLEPMGFFLHGLFRGLRRPHPLGQTPIHDQHLAEVADHDVVRFEVAVDHVARMGKRHGIAGLLKDGQQAGQRILCNDFLFPAPDVFEHVGQRQPPHILHRVVRTPVRILPQFVNGHDVGMFQLGGDLRFFDKPCQVLRAPAWAVGQNFHGHRAPAMFVVRLVDGAHPSLRQQSSHLVFADALLRKNLGKFAGFVGRAHRFGLPHGNANRFYSADSGFAMNRRGTRFLVPGLFLRFFFVFPAHEIVGSVSDDMSTSDG